MLVYSPVFGRIVAQQQSVNTSVAAAAKVQAPACQHAAVLWWYLVIAAHVVPGYSSTCSGTWL
jgi:hypothetical protein